MRPEIDGETMSGLSRKEKDDLAELSQPMPSEQGGFWLPASYATTEFHSYPHRVPSSSVSLASLHISSQVYPWMPFLWKPRYCSFTKGQLAMV